MSQNPQFLFDVGSPNAFLSHEAIPAIEWHYAPTDGARPEGEFNPYRRDPRTLARPWAVPGQVGLMHRIGGIEKSAESGDISYDPGNHHRMTLARAERAYAR